MRRNMRSMNTPTAAQMASSISDVMRYPPNLIAEPWKLMPPSATLLLKESVPTDCGSCSLLST